MDCDIYLKATCHQQGKRICFLCYAKDKVFLLNFLEIVFVYFLTLLFNEASKTRGLVDGKQLEISIFDNITQV